MEPYQFALFFAALAIGYLLVHLRLVRFERYLQQIAALQKLDDRLVGIADTLNGLPLDRLEAGLGALHADAEELTDSVRRIERGITRLGQQDFDGQQAGRSAQVQAPAERVCSAVEQRLFQLGYQKPRILTQLHDARLEDDLVLQVECERGMMPYKGKVLVRNGAVLDVDLHTVVGMFP